ncbi:MAG: hypothetical protein Unbinned1473contig1000_44 [Prokaryotic dsDNA virus sp.]|nr:MAG: hypothetical protein Unbinned1473contig1000_44 [Prokaryotic dsDNA virus sp.]
MSNTETVEQAFLNDASVKRALKLTKLDKLKATVQSATEKRFNTSLELAQIVSEGVEWFSSDAAKARLEDSGLDWNKETFINKAFGMQKSYAYKLIKANAVEEIVLDTFRANAEKLSIAELLKFAKAVGEVEDGMTSSDILDKIEDETDGEGDGEGKDSNKSQTIFSFVFKGAQMMKEDKYADLEKVNLTIEDDLVIHTKSDKDDILKAIELLQVLVTQM